MKRFALVSALVASPLCLTTCGGTLPHGLGIETPDCSKEFETGNFSTVKADAKILGFLDASYKFNAVVTQMEVDLIAVCAELGKAAGLTEAELQAAPQQGEGAKKVCELVGAKVEALLKASTKGSVQLEMGEPTCKADVDSLVSCFGKCGSPVQPGELKAACQGGELTGTCGGKCSGTCSVEAGAACSGTCGGSCSGACEADFSGKCGGDCQGKCDGKDSKAKCDGVCEGKCSAEAEGSCGGKCEGTCSTSCEVQGEAECKGECKGECDVELESPKCSGEFKPPQVSVDCQAQCAAKTAAAISCDPPRVVIKTTGEVSAELKNLIPALQVALPKLIVIGKGTAKAAASAGTQLAGELKGVASAASSAGLKAAACGAMAVDAVGKAAGSIDVNVKASMSVSAAASGKASASTGG